MKESEKDNKVTNNQNNGQEKSPLNGQEKNGVKPEATSTMVEDAQTDAPKEHEDNEHQHETKTPVGDKKQVNENQGSTKIAGKSL